MKTAVSPKAADSSQSTINKKAKVGKNKKKKLLKKDRKAKHQMDSVKSTRLTRASLKRKKRRIIEDDDDDESNHEEECYNEE